MNWFIHLQAPEALVIIFRWVSQSKEEPKDSTLRLTRYRPAYRLRAFLVD